MLEDVLDWMLVIWGVLAVGAAAFWLAELLKEVNYLLGLLRWHRDRLETTELIIIETRPKTMADCAAICDAVHGHSEVVSMMSSACAASPHLLDGREPEIEPQEENEGTTHEILPCITDPLGADRDGAAGAAVHQAAVDIAADRPDRTGDGHEEGLPTDGSWNCEMG